MIGLVFHTTISSEALETNLWFLQDLSKIWQALQWMFCGFKALEELQNEI